MRKSLTKLALLVLSLSMVLVGCSKKEEVKTSGDTAKMSSEKLSFPLKEKVELTVFVHTRPNVDNYDENEFTKYIEEKTNIDLKFVMASENEAQQKLNLLLATGDYPDIILASQLSYAQQALYGAQGILLPLNELIEKYGDNTKKVFDAIPVAKERSTMPDGNIYNLPKINECYHCKSTQKMWIYEPWLKKLGLKMPETTEEYYKVLKAFATQDPNGNGKADEIPLAGANKGWETQVDGFLMNPFVYHAINQSGANRLFVKNGKVTASFAEEGWKEGLKYIQRLVKDGLLAPESFTQSGEGLKQMGENPETVILGSFPGGYSGVATDLSGERWRGYVTVPPLKGPDGTRFVKYDPFSSFTPAFSITDKCEYPEIAMMLGDLFYEQETTLRNTLGRAGIEWEYVTDSSKAGINGKPAIWEEVIPFVEQGPNLSWNQMGNTFRSSTLRLGRYQEDPNNIEVVLYKETMEKYAPYYPSTDMLLPPMTLTESQSSELLTYTTTINEYVNEKIAEFVLTNVNIDNQWSAYINELKNIGLDSMLAVYQEAYDAR